MAIDSGIWPAFCRGQKKYKIAFNVPEINHIFN